MCVCIFLLWWHHHLHRVTRSFLAPLLCFESGVLGLLLPDCSLTTPPNSISLYLHAEVYFALSLISKALVIKINEVWYSLSLGLWLWWWWCSRQLPVLLLAPLHHKFTVVSSFLRELCCFNRHMCTTMSCSLLHYILYYYYYYYIIAIIIMIVLLNSGRLHCCLWRKDTFSVRCCSSHILSLVDVLHFYLLPSCSCAALLPAHQPLHPLLLLTLHFASIFSWLFVSICLTVTPELLSVFYFALLSSATEWSVLSFQMFDACGWWVICPW